MGPKAQAPRQLTLSRVKHRSFVVSPGLTSSRYCAATKLDPPRTWQAVPGTPGWCASLGSRREGLVERGYFVNVSQGKVEAFPHLNQCLSRKVVHFLLNILEDTDQGSLLIAVPLNDFAHCLQIDRHLSFSPPPCLWQAGRPPTQKGTRRRSLESVRKLRF